MRARMLIVALVALALVTAALATVMVGHQERPPAQVTEGRALIGGPFTLTDHAGRRVTEAEFRGRFMLLQFGYTYCPDMCPLGLQVMAQALDELPPAVAEQVVPVFVTVDPTRDTVEVLRDYVALFHPRLIGLTGSEEEIAAVIRAWRVYARKADPAAGGAYLVDHSTFTYLMGRDGAYVTHFGHGTPPETMAGRVAELVAPTS